MKRLLILASVAVLTMGAVACTREKPTSETPTAPVGPRDVTPAPETPGAATPAAPTTAVPTDTPVPTAVSVIVPTVVFTSTSVPTAPAPTRTPAATVLPASAPGTYTVQWGDTLGKIALKFGVTTQAIVAANPGLNPNYIVPGQVLVIPAAGGAEMPEPTASAAQPAACTPTYTVQRGDWFYAIARRFGVSVTALAQANPSINSNIVYPGQVLNIPCGTNPAPSGGTTPSGKSYVVRPGDTLFSIAIRFGTTVYAIQIANNLSNPHSIYVGQVLSIPR